MDLDFQITSLEIGRCSGTLKRRWKSDGPFKSTHGVALTLFAETLGGLAIFTRLGAKGKGILMKTETQYLKKAKGKSNCEKGLIIGTVTGFAAFDTDEKSHTSGEAECEVIMKDAQADVVAKVRDSNREIANGRRF
jgi:acyl-coenzyme A thioesterase PaaI-like protein